MWNKILSLHNVSWKDSKWPHCISQLSSVCKNPCINMEHLDYLDYYNNFLSALKKYYLCIYCIFLLCCFDPVSTFLVANANTILLNFLWIQGVYVDFVHFCTYFVLFIFITVSNMEHKCTKYVPYSQLWITCSNYLLILGFFQASLGYS